MSLSKIVQESVEQTNKDLASLIIGGLKDEAIAGGITIRFNGDTEVKLRKILISSQISLLEAELERKKGMMYKDSFFSEWKEEREKLKDTATKEEAISFIEKIIPLADTCPFCGEVPKFTYRVDERDKSGSVGHFTNRVGCCDAIGAGKCELFFCNDNKPENYGLWAGLMFWQVVKWNSRSNQSIQEDITYLQEQIAEIKKTN